MGVLLGNHGSTVFSQATRDMQEESKKSAQSRTAKLEEELSQSEKRRKETKAKLKEAELI